MTYKSALKVLAVVLVAFLLLAWLLAAIGAVARAAGCTVTPMGNYTSVNIRATTVRDANGNPTGSIIGQLLAGKSLDANPAVNNFYSVPGGFIAASVVTATGCNSGQQLPTIPAMPSATFTATLIPTATSVPSATPGLPGPTPTRIVVQSWVWVDGQVIACLEDPCKIIVARHYEDLPKGYDRP